VFLTLVESMKVAYDAGVNFFDTAEVYSGGQSEIVLGEAIKKWGRGTEWAIVFLTLVEMTRSFCFQPNFLIASPSTISDCPFQIYWGKANSANPDKPLNNNGLSRKHIIEGMNLSLQRLALPYVGDAPGVRNLTG
jgi:aryl-alcohol dehydrogenase-like predicted oxidoreductase